MAPQKVECIHSNEIGLKQNNEQQLRISSVEEDNIVNVLFRDLERIHCVLCQVEITKSW